MSAPNILTLFLSYQVNVWKCIRCFVFTWKLLKYFDQVTDKASDCTSRSTENEGNESIWSYDCRYLTLIVVVVAINHYCSMGCFLCPMYVGLPACNASIFLCIYGYESLA